MEINNTKMISFKSGLTPGIKKIVKNIDINAIESTFLNDYRVDANFNNNKMLASYFAMVLNIFESVSEKFNLPFIAVPPRIRVFLKKNLLNKNLSNNFCLSESGKVLRDELPFEIRSIFMRNIKNMNIANQKNDFSYMNKQRSSSHFLSDVIHEWSHNVHLALICKKYGFNIFSPNNIEYKNIVEQFSNYNPNKEIKTQIFESLGAYAANSNSKMEIFAEGLTKIITSSLDEKSLNIKKNPMDNLLSLPKSIKLFIESQIF